MHSYWWRFPQVKGGHHHQLKRLHGGHDTSLRYEGCNSAYTTEEGPELSLNQLEEKLLNKEENRRYQGITGATYLTQVTPYDILYVVNQLASVMSKPAKTHMRAAKHLLRYLAESTDFSITYKQGSFKVAAFSDANWGNSLDNDGCMSSYIVTLANAPVISKVALQGLTAQYTMEADTLVAALAMK